MSTNSQAVPLAPVPPSLILITGATGKVGRHLVTGLLEEGVPVRALTRGSPDPGLPDGTEMVRWDPGQPATPAPRTC